MHAGPRPPRIPILTEADLQEEVELERRALEDLERENHVTAIEERARRIEASPYEHDSYEGRHLEIESEVRSLGLSYREEEGLWDEEPLR